MTYWGPVHNKHRRLDWQQMGLGVLISKKLFNGGRKDIRDLNIEVFFVSRKPQTSKSHVTAILPSRLTFEFQVSTFQH